MELQPGRRLGPFVLGMPIGSAIRYLQEHERDVSVVELQFDPDNVLAFDICLDLKEECVRLHFDPSLQTLRKIHVYDVGRVRLVYEKRAFTGNRAPDPTLLALYGTFGPSYPGVLDAQHSCYHLNYPGVGFVFPIPEQYAHLYASGSTEAPVELPDKSMPLARELFVFRGKALMEPQDVPLSKITQALPDCKHYFEPLLLVPGKGLHFVSRSAWLLLGCGPQEVLSLLGSPSKQHCKRENKLKIHSERSASLSTQDYFYNYFSLGLDILFDGCSHRAIKFVVHSNFPTHDSFNQYCKCNWSITLDTRDNTVVTADSKWSEVRDALGIDARVKPVVHNRASDDRPRVNSDGSASAASLVSSSGANTSTNMSPTHFSTCFFGRAGLILEVMKNDLIETVILY